MFHQALVTQWGQPPSYVAAPSLPPPAEGSIQLKVLVVGLHHVVRARAAGEQLSFGTLPHVPGTDGVGITSDGQLVYFSIFDTCGSFSEFVNVPKLAITPLPDGLDITQVAAFVNPCLSSWMALTRRTVNLPANFTVVIMGVNSTYVAFAESVARALGAKTVFGAGHNLKKMEAMDLDGRIELKTNVTKTDFSMAAEFDVVLDYLFGLHTKFLFSSPLGTTKPVQYVQIGELGSSSMTLTASILRSKNITIRGLGPGTTSNEELAQELPKLLVSFAQFENKPLDIFPLKDIAKGWNSSAGRTVFTVASL